MTGLRPAGPSPKDRSGMPLCDARAQARRGCRWNGRADAKHPQAHRGVGGQRLIRPQVFALMPAMFVAVATVRCSARAFISSRTPPSLIT